MNNLPEHHSPGPPEARGTMQLHRLHRLKAGPARLVITENSVVSQPIRILDYARDCRPVKISYGSHGKVRDTRESQRTSFKKTHFLTST